MSTTVQLPEGWPELWEQFDRKLEVLSYCDRLSPLDVGRVMGACCEKPPRLCAAWRAWAAIRCNASTYDELIDYAWWAVRAQREEDA